MTSSISANTPQSQTADMDQTNYNHILQAEGTDSNDMLGVESKVESLKPILTNLMSLVGQMSNQFGNSESQDQTHALGTDIIGDAKSGQKATETSDNPGRNGEDVEDGTNDINNDTSGSNQIDDSDDTTTDDDESSGAGGVNNVDASSDATVVNETIVVEPGETFDGGNQTYTAGSALGDGSQDEGQEPIFRLEEGATMQNVVIGDNGADGVHVYGDATIDNVHWTDVGEDALSIKDSGDDGIADVQVTNSSAQDADDKIFQVNADAKLTIDNFVADNFGQFVRTNGGQQGDFEINLNDITATNSKDSLVRSDAEGIVVNASNINAENIEELWELPDSATLSENI
jgi:hypothetical protein